MHLVARDHVRGTHRPALVAAALADADAAKDGRGEASVVLGVTEDRFRLRGTEISAEAEIVENVARVHDFARIHLPFGVPDALELAERIDEIRTVHALEEHPARLAVAVLAGERAAHDE